MTEMTLSNSMVSVSIKEAELSERPNGDRATMPPASEVKVELGKIRREMLTLASRVDKLIQGQD